MPSKTVPRKRAARSVPRDFMGFPDSAELAELNRPLPDATRCRLEAIARHHALPEPAQFALAVWKARGELILNRHTLKTASMPARDQRQLLHELAARAAATVEALDLVARRSMDVLPALVGAARSSEVRRALLPLRADSAGEGATAPPIEAPWALTSPDFARLRWELDRLAAAALLAAKERPASSRGRTGNPEVGAFLLALRCELERQRGESLSITKRRGAEPYAGLWFSVALEVLPAVAIARPRGAVAIGNAIEVAIERARQSAK